MSAPPRQVLVVLPLVVAPAMKGNDAHDDEGTMDGQTASPSPVCIIHQAHIDRSLRFVCVLLQATCLQRHFRNICPETTLDVR